MEEKEIEMMLGMELSQKLYDDLVAKINLWECGEQEKIKTIESLDNLVILLQEGVKLG